MRLGVTPSKADGAGLQEIGFDYDPSNPSPDNGEGYLKKITRGAGPTTEFSGHDAFGNPTLVTTTVGDEKTMATERVFDAWDRAYQTTIAPGGGDGVEGTITTRYDELRADPKDRAFAEGSGDGHHHYRATTNAVRSRR